MILLGSSQGLIIMRCEFSTSRLDCLLTGVHVQPLALGPDLEASASVRLSGQKIHPPDEALLMS